MSTPIDPYKHPYWSQTLPSTPEDLDAVLADMGEQRYKQTVADIIKRIEAEQADPYRYGIELKHWQAADLMLSKGYDELLISGGNRSGKTEYCAKKIIKTMLAKPHARVWCFHTTHQSSLQVQQPVVYKYIPYEYRAHKVKRGRISHIKYDQKNGFSDNTFIFPNGAQCTFMHYSQKPDVWEGAEIDFCWMDELVPIHVLSTVRYRLVTRRGKLLVSFTPIEGYSLTVKDFIQGGTITTWADSPLLPGANIEGGPVGKMPFTMRCRRPRTGAIWFFTQWNPYNRYEELCRVLKGSSTPDIKIRAYGWADNTIGNSFPRFNDEVHVVKPDQIPSGGFNMFVLDPATSRNWFMLWAKVVEGNVYIYREWPDWRVGEWAVPSEKADGSPGAAQRSGAGLSIEGYKAHIQDLESEEVFLRLIDPRAAGTTTSTGKTLLEELETNHPSTGGMYFATASGKDIKDGVELINDLLFYQHGVPVDDSNSPRLYISSECKNLIYCMKEWTGADGQRGATKDPIDCMRYLVLEDPLNISPRAMEVTGGGSY